MFVQLSKDPWKSWNKDDVHWFEWNYRNDDRVNFPIIFYSWIPLKGGNVIRTKGHRDVDRQWINIPLYAILWHVFACHYEVFLYPTLWVGTVIPVLRTANHLKVYLLSVFVSTDQDLLWRPYVQVYDHESTFVGRSHWVWQLEPRDDVLPCVAPWKTIGRSEQCLISQTWYVVVIWPFWTLCITISMRHVITMASLS